ncbi:valine--tRNA ligase [Streptomyces alboflavus]|uniref:Valine--tRNA ligase n=1 Tax=Streptomyces alboflavus TaxID=67267 RepID=A0A1Z1WMZ0_9ACTN|nr:valine--tRNA ligase [Streptomyces alboflavus]ARX87730.1 valine--tRNA ligase [Streptomyces alboflavus]
MLATAAEVIAGVRKAKSLARLSMRAEIATVVVRGPRDVLDRFALAAADVRAAGRVGEVVLEVADGALAVEVLR